MPQAMLLIIIATAILVSPVAAGLTITNGDKITTPFGSTSLLFNITETPILENGTITIDLYNLMGVVDGGALSSANVVITDSAANATWTGIVDDNYLLTLTSTQGATDPDESVTVTFTGAVNPWIPDTYGEWPITMYAIRTDDILATNYEFTVLFDIAHPSPFGLSIADGARIDTTSGATSPVITVIENNITAGNNITIDVTYLNHLVASGVFTTDNVVINSDADPVNWAGEVSGNVLTLYSTGGETAIDKNISVTFTGAVNPWISDTGGEKIALLTVTRTDGLGLGYFYFDINIQPPGNLTVETGATITTTAGTTSPVIIITNAEIASGVPITINVIDLHKYVASGNFTSDNVIVSDTAINADWTGMVEGNNLILNSTGIATVKYETVTVSFTGATNPWVNNTGGEKTVVLPATRGDTLQSALINVKIDISPPIDITPDLNFIAVPTSGNAPLTVNFTDTSTVNPINWTWDFGDGSEYVQGLKNPTHIYEKAGSYTVSLWIENVTSNGMVSKSNYITVFNKAIREADTSIAGLTIGNCAGPQQTIEVNTSILSPAVLTSGNSVLEIQPPSGSGFKTIIFYGTFLQSNNLITGNPTSVHLESEDIAPSAGFSSDIGPNASFYYAVDLSSFPCNAKLSTEISEGVTPYYDAKFRQMASANDAFPVGTGTAYTARITKTNFPSGVPAKIYMSINSDWRRLVGDPTSNIFIWRIADDDTYGQILPTHWLYTENNLDYYEADSPLGLSTIGISATTGNNNPFQMIAFVAANVINQGSNAQSSSPGSSTGTSVSTNDAPGSPYSDIQGGGIVVPTPETPKKPSPLTQPAMSTNVGMVGWLLAIIQDYPIILVGVAGAIVVVGYFGWWKQRL